MLKSDELAETANQLRQAMNACTDDNSEKSFFVEAYCAVENLRLLHDVILEEGENICDHIMAQALTRRDVKEYDRLNDELQALFDRKTPLAERKAFLYGAHPKNNRGYYSGYPVFDAAVHELQKQRSMLTEADYGNGHVELEPLYQQYEIERFDKILCEFGLFRIEQEFTYCVTEHPNPVSLHCDVFFLERGAWDEYVAYRKAAYKWHWKHDNPTPKEVDEFIEAIMPSEYFDWCEQVNELRESEIRANGGTA